MSRIHILPPSLADKIAAGEVVERPASVVKELIENSLDAGAAHVRVDIRKAGRELIQVSDDGSGMTLEEAKLCIQRHATSKIETESDLFAIQTLGFRGEALPSIAAVSRLTLETKSKEGEGLEGTCVEVRGGDVLAARAAGCPIGSRVAVQELFYNTPARLKFLKSDGVELGHIEDTFVRLALGHFNCGFDFYVEDSQKLSCPIAKDPLQRLKGCLGDSFIEDLIEVREENPELELKGWIVHPRQTTSNANAIYFYLNGRFLKDKVLQHALAAGFEDFLMKGRYPKAVLYLKMNPREFDVNVHPTKREVRFVRSQAVHEFVAKAVKKVVQKKIYESGESPLLCKEGEGEGRSTPPFPSPYKGEGKNRIQRAVERFYGTRLEPKAKPESKPEIQPAFRAVSFKELKVLGALAHTYILCEAADHRLILVDQHAAHERIGFEKLKRNLESQTGISQRLLIPLTWEGNSREASILQTHLDSLKQAGLEIEPFGGNTFAIKGAPSLVAESKIPELLEKIAEDLEELGTSAAIEKITEQVLKTIACHAQVRAKDKLSPEEMQHLLIEMDEYHATYCPHGRPTTVEISLGQIERWFKRT